MQFSGEVIGFKTGHTAAGEVLLGAVIEGKAEPELMFVFSPEEAVDWADSLMKSADDAVHASRASRRG